MNRMHPFAILLILLSSVVVAQHQVTPSDSRQSLAAANEAAAESIAGIGPPTMTIEATHGRRGYEAQAIWISQALPDHGINRDDVILGWLDGKENRETRGLVRFDKLDIPHGSKIVEAELSMFVGTAVSSPTIEVFGLLKEFIPSAKSWGGAATGESTWNSQRHGQARWGKPGLDEVSDEFEFDQLADRAATTDDSVIVKRPGRVRLDVTRSFSAQQESSHSYGWLLKINETDTERQAVIARRGMKLKVRFMPPEDHVPSPPFISRPRLISFHIGHATTIGQNPARIEDLPFEGAVFLGKANDKREHAAEYLCNAVMGPQRMTVDDYVDFITAMKRIHQPPSRLQHNFLRVNLCVPGTLTPRKDPYTWESRPRGDDRVTMWWADGFDVIEHNIAVAARVAKEAGMAGLFLDYEQYGGDIWSMGKQQDATDRAKSAEDTRAQVRQRAIRFVEAINREFPDMTLMVIFGLYSENDDILWNPFCDGLVNGADARMRIVNGNETTYYAESRREFQKEYDDHYTDAQKYSTKPEKYLKQTEVGFGVYLNPNGWSERPELESSPALWQTKVEHAMEIADSYVWVYIGPSGDFRPDWWTGHDLPQVYFDATRRGVDLARRRRDL